MALSGILSRLLTTGTVLLVTRNRAPRDLNQLESSFDCEIFPCPFPNLHMKIKVLEFPEICNGVAKFTFEDLCGRPVGAADYIVVAKNYHRVFISDIPLMSMRIRDKALRFITLIDELYNHHCCLFCSAASSIDDSFQGDLVSFPFETETGGGKLRTNVLAEGNVGSGGAPSGIVSMLSGQEEMFAFRRAVSCWIEMQTPLYLEGVRSLHPYFQKQHQGFGNDQSSNLQSRASS